MPYIKEERRNAIDGDVTYNIDLTELKNAGELNYAFTVIAHHYLSDGENYQRINDIIGALEGCKLELYRRVAAPYEDVKIKENGDVQ